MENKATHLFNSKLVLALLCLAVLLTLGLGSAMASGGGENTPQVPSAENNAHFGINFSKDSDDDNLWVEQDENGAIRYSTDEGKTWHDGLPDGVELMDETAYDELFKDGESQDSQLGESEEIILTEGFEDGSARYSTDGGSTWHDGLPDGIDFEMDGFTGITGLASRV